MWAKWIDLNESQNVSHCQQQCYSGLRSPGWSYSTYWWNDSWVQTFHSSNESAVKLLQMQVSCLQIPWDCHTYNSRHRALASSVLCLARLHLGLLKITEQAALSVWNGLHSRHSVIKPLFWTSFLFLLYLANWTACANQSNSTADSGTGSCSFVWYIYFTSLICFQEL